MNLIQLLEQIDYYKRQISTLCPMQEPELRGLNDYYKVGNTYSSNALEGNTLTLTEQKYCLKRASQCTASQ